MEGTWGKRDLDVGVDMSVSVGKAYQGTCISLLLVNRSECDLKPLHVSASLCFCSAQESGPGLRQRRTG